MFCFVLNQYLVWSHIFLSVSVPFQLQSVSSSLFCGYKIVVSILCCHCCFLCCFFFFLLFSFVFSIQYLIVIVCTVLSTVCMRDCGLLFYICDKCATEMDIKKYKLTDFMAFLLSKVIKMENWENRKQYNMRCDIVKWIQLNALMHINSSLCCYCYCFLFFLFDLNTFCIHNLVRWHNIECNVHYRLNLNRWCMLVSVTWFNLKAKFFASFMLLEFVFFFFLLAIVWFAVDSFSFCIVYVLNLK